MSTIRQPKFKFGQEFEIEIVATSKEGIKVKGKVKAYVVTINLTSNETDYYYEYELITELPSAYNDGGQYMARPYKETELQKLFRQ